MPAIVANQETRWQDHVPYVIDASVNRIWLLGKIVEFNTRAGRNVFVQRTDEADYAWFRPGANSPVGKQGNAQDLRFNASNLFHEMGHCVGLGHVYFHRGSELPALFEGNDRLAYDGSRGHYADQGFANVDSMMGYTPTVFPDSPRVRRVCAWCFNHRQFLGAASNSLQELIRLLSQPPAATPQAKFQVSLQIPHKFRNQPMHFKVGGQWWEGLVSNYDVLHALDPADLAQFASDIRIVERYWKFNPGFMMRVTDDDVQAIHAVLRP